MTIVEQILNLSDEDKKRIMSALLRAAQGRLISHTPDDFLRPGESNDQYQKRRAEQRARERNAAKV